MIQLLILSPTPFQLYPANFLDIRLYRY